MGFGNRRWNERARPQSGDAYSRRRPPRPSQLGQRLLKEALAIAGMLAVLVIFHVARQWLAAPPGTPEQRLTRIEVYIVAAAMAAPWYAFRLVLGLPAYGEE